VADTGLQAVSPLRGYAETIGGIALSEVTGLGLVAVAPSQGEERALEAALNAGYGLDWPATGQSVTGGDVRLLGMARDQAFLMFPHDGFGAVSAAHEKLGAAGWLTDQSDSWAMLRVSGADVRAALERICMLDLHPDAFGAGMVQRTTMDHLAVIILREEADTFLLMSPTSSAESFLDAVVTSARNIVSAN